MVTKVIMAWVGIYSKMHGDAKSIPTIHTNNSPYLAKLLLKQMIRAENLKYKTTKLGTELRDYANITQIGTCEKSGKN